MSLQHTPPFVPVSRPAPLSTSIQMEPNPSMPAGNLFDPSSASLESTPSERDLRMQSREMNELHTRIAELERQNVALQNQNVLANADPLSFPGGPFDLYGSSSALLPTFTAAPGQSFKLWLENFDLVAADQQWNDDSKRQKLPLLLRGSARQIFSELPSTERTSYTRLKAALKLKFVRPESVHTSRTALSNRTQGSTESVHDFGLALKALA